VAISLVGTSTGGPTLNDVTITLPAGIAQNDVVYAAGMTGTIADQDVTESSGTYTELADLYSNDTNDTNLGVYRKVQGATPDSSVTIDAGTNNIGVALTLRGVNTTTPEDATTTTATAPNNGTPDPPSIVTATANAWVLPFAASSEGDAVTNPPTNYTNLVDIQDGPRNVMASSREIASPGTEDPGAYDDIAGQTSDSWSAATVAVRPAPAVIMPPPPTIINQAVQRAAFW